MDAAHYNKAVKKAAALGLMVYPSPNKRHKLYFHHPITGRVVYFGDPRYEDYLQHEDDVRRARYRTRHAGILTADGRPAYSVKYSPAWAAYHILW